MRDFKGMKRQRGRNRSSSGGGSSGGKPQQHNANRAFESNGPDNLKIRGHAQHVYEKYQQLARDATSSGDRVLAENFMQHAEHYFRLLRTLQPNRPYTDFIAREGFAAGYDIDFEDESGAGEGGDEGEGSSEGGGEGQQSPLENGEYQSRDGRWESRDNRTDQNRDARQNQNDRQNQSDRQGQGQGQDTRSFNGPRRDRDRSFNNQPRDNQPRDNQPRDNQSRDNQTREGQNRDGRWENREGRDDRTVNRDQPREGRWENRGERTESEGGQANGYQQRDRGERNDRSDRYERRERSYEPRLERDAPRDPLAVVEPQAQPLTAQPLAAQSVTAQPAAAQPLTSAPAIEDAKTAAAPRRRMLRSQDGEESHAPAFLQSAPTLAAEDSEPAPKRRGRPRKKVEETAPEEV